MRKVLVSAMASVALLFAGMANAASVDIHVNKITDTSWSVTVDDNASVPIAAISFFMAGATGFTFAPTLNVSVLDSVNRINGPAEDPPSVWNLSINPPAGTNLIDSGLGVALGTFTTSRPLTQADAIPGDAQYGATVFDPDFNVVDTNIIVAPEPTTALLLGFGLAGLAMVRRRTN